MNSADFRKEARLDLNTKWHKFALFGLLLFFAERIRGFFDSDNQSGLNISSGLEKVKQVSEGSFVNDFVTNNVNTGTTLSLNFDILYFSIDALLVVPVAIAIQFLCLTNTRELSWNLDTYFKQMKEVGYGKIVLVGLLRNVYTFLWFLLLIIPGFIKIYSYRMTPYILRDNENYGYNDCVTASRNMMDGNKWELFKLDLSFIGWMIVGILTFGFGYIYIMPYYYSAQAAFYEYIRDDQDRVKS